MATEKEVHLVRQEVPISLLDCRAAFNLLDSKEKHYAHHLSQAAWAGSLICLHQASAESPAIFQVLQLMFAYAGGAKALKEKCTQQPYNVTLERYDEWLQYAVTFYGNFGNYFARGDLKFIPRCSVDDVDVIIRCAADCAKSEKEHEQLLAAWQTCREAVFSLKEGEKMVSWPPAGTCSYYSPDVTKADVQVVNAFCLSKGLPMSHQEINSRLWKRSTGDGQSVLELRLASSEPLPPAVHHHDGVEIHIVGSEYGTHLKAVVSHIEKALPFAANAHQKQMLEDYIKHFQTGSIQYHVDSQRHWVDDKGPVVETQLGFIEPYRDPSGLRGEWQGTIAILNKESSAKFSALVEHAEELLKFFPWPRDFEKDVFLCPDFISVEVLAFASTHIWSGQNLPNYDEIRQSYGFKNLSYGNVVRSDFRKPGKKVALLSEASAALYDEHSIRAFEVQVGIHELLGHGSGKLFMENPDGSLNFDASTCQHPITGGKIESWYKPGQTYPAVFSGFNNAMEECRADACGIYLCNQPEILDIFSIPETQHKSVTYVNWLWGVRSGFMALKFYSPEERKWRQAHMQGRYAILQVLLEAGQGFVKYQYDEEKEELLVDVDMDLLESVARPAIAQLLLKLQAYKSTADVTAAAEYFLGLTKVTDEMLKFRPIMIANAPPEGVFVQCNTFITADGTVELREYSADTDGVVQSFLERYPQ